MQSGVRKGFLIIFLATLLLPTGYSSQGEPGGELRYLLEVRRRQVDLREARARFERTTELFSLGLVAEAEVGESRTAVDRAQINYQDSLLSLLSVQPRISVIEAVKFVGEDGRKGVRLTVANLTPQFDDSQLELLTNFEGAEPIPDALRTRNIRDVFISLKDTGEANALRESSPRGTTVAFPYEVHIPEFPYGAQKTLEFQLLRDVNSMVVAIGFQGLNRELDIQLQQAETENVVSINASQISQEADLGTQANYSLLLERSSVNTETLQLTALNLPHGIQHSFIDRESEARISQIYLPAGETQRRIGLRLFLPERAGDALAIDEPIEFWAVAVSAESRELFAQDRRYSEAEIEVSRAGGVRLAVIPRGVGRIEVNAASLFSEISKDESARTVLPVRNAGSRTLENTEIIAEAPLDWRVEIEPSLISRLAVGAEAQVRLTIILPRDVVAGDYEVRIRTQSYAYNRRVPSEDKIYRVRVKSASSQALTLGLLVTLVLALGAIVFFGVRMTRR